MGDFVKAIVKLMIMVVLAALVVSGAFSAGYVARAIQIPAGVQAVEPVVQQSPQIIFSDEDVPPEFKVFWEAWAFIEQEFYGEIPAEQDRIYGAVRGMVNAFGDENTAFIEPGRAAIFREDVSGSFEGIGAAVRMDELGRLVIAEPFAGRPAAEAGVLRGDVVIAVDGTSLQGLSLYEAIGLIRGPAGSTVVLTIFRDGIDEPFEVPVVRARIEIEVVGSERLAGDIGYVRLTEFSRGATGKMAEAIKALNSEGPLKGLVLDLRDNPGGLLDESIFVSSQFIDEGVITIERLKGDEDQVFEAQAGGVAPDVPLVVLVNRGSASASEIVAGAIQENGRGTVLGEQTFGKGTVQIPHTLSDGSELRVTIAEWLTPGGKQISGEGIVPDVYVERTQEDFVEGRDPQLDRAVEYLLETN
ncbi:MAG: S41 family peptidase [Anaerolineales bacterium]|nr:MAG: S41 family peptidase [Anaerolineales bacterium]